MGTEKRGPWGCLNWLESELSPGRVRAEPRFLCCKIKNRACLDESILGLKTNLCEMCMFSLCLDVVPPPKAH